MRQISSPLNCPWLVRGLYYEKWTVGRPRRQRARYPRCVCHELRGHLELQEAAHVMNVVLQAVARYLGQGGRQSHFRRVRADGETLAAAAEAKDAVQ
jgi:hypothetical protein